MASRAEDWLGRLRAGLAIPPAPRDPKHALLARVVGEPTVELLAALAAPARPAAVLVGFVERSGGPHLVLTERGAHLKDHPGQVSFPGGRVAPADADAIAAALRESQEEIGLVASQVEVLGCLPEQLTVTGFVVTPVLALLAPEWQPIPDPGEVDAVFEVPLAHLLDRKSLAIEFRDRLGTRFRSGVYVFEGHRIWGATASILEQAIRLIE